MDLVSVIQLRYVHVLYVYLYMYILGEGGRGGRETQPVHVHVFIVECITAGREDCGDFDFINYYFSNYYNCFSPALLVLRQSPSNSY